VSDDAAAGWILARVIKYVPDRDQYHVRDEDDHSNLMTVSSSNVIRLTEENIGDVKKDDTVSHTNKTHISHMKTEKRHPPPFSAI
jgi:hypothetical protein